MKFLEILESTAFSQWVLISMLGFPTLIAVHSIGMAVAAGLTIVVALYLNRVLAGIADTTLPGLLRIAMWGFMLNLVTGLSLFVARGTEYITNATFLVKMLLVLVSGAILVWLKSRIGELASEPGEVFENVAARRLSLVCSATWIGAVVTGRLIAYIGTIY